MARGFAAVPRARRYVLANATLPAALVNNPPGVADANGLIAADVTVRDGRIERLDPPNRPTRLPALDMHGGMIFPTFVDMHTHIDKGHIWPRKQNPDGTFEAAMAAVGQDRAAHWSADDVARRMDFSLRSAYAYGTSLLRTHLDSAPPQHAISWPVFSEMRARWAGKVELQGVGLIGGDYIFDDGFMAELASLIATHGGILGGAVAAPRDGRASLDKLVFWAREGRLDLDLHVDETEDPESRCLRHLAEAVIALGYEGKVNAGHCCAIARQMTDEADETLDLVAKAGISVVSLPMCNMYLQDRHTVGDAPRTPRWRGVTLLHEMRSRGIPVAIASDNTRDPFYAYGDLDMVEVLREGTRIVHLDHPIAEWPSAVARTPAEILRRPEAGVIAAGLPADLVLFKARNWSELLARPQSDRTVLRLGTAIDRRFPDYRELDDLMGLSS
jgi:cytosine/creatinine deaminase